MIRARLRRARAQEDGLPFFDAWTRRNAPTHPDSSPEASLWSGRDAAAPRWRRTAGIVALVAASATGAVVLSGSASADPSAHTWYRLRMCESSDNYATNTGNGHYGAYQFDVSTWESVGGSGLPSNASKNEQDARALILYRERGWQPWQCAGILGLHPDADAGSGYIGDISIRAGGVRHSTHHRRTHSGVPAFPGGSHWYYYGDWNNQIKTFQNEMHSRGYFPVGTGQYGPKTLHMVKKLQRLNGLPATGYIGPNTWALAWTGTYTRAAHHPTHHQRPTHHRHVTHHPHSTRIPDFPGGSHWYYYGEWNDHIKTFQNEMHSRGYFPVGTGQYGPKTLHMVKKLQRLNGLVPNGYIGPNTWKLAWTGTYTR